MDGEILILGTLESLADPAIQTSPVSIEIGNAHHSTSLQGSDISNLFRGPLTAINASFFSTTLQGRQINGAWFAGCTFQNANLRNLEFLNCDFSGCWFDDATITESHFLDCRIDESMRGTNLRNVKFERCDLHLNMSFAQLESVAFCDLSLEALELESRSNINLSLHNTTGTPVIRRFTMDSCDVDALRRAGWRPNPTDRSSQQSRQEQIVEIDREFGDETEAWYQKWVNGLLDE